METLYLVCLLVGGFFVLLSIFGGGETDADSDVDFDADADFDADFDADYDADVDADADIDFDASGADGGVDFVDLLSVRALFLFAAFFGLTGTLLSWLGGTEPLTAVLSVLTGLVVGLGGNYLIKRVGYAHVSSDVTVGDLKGRTGTVLLPFAADQAGKVNLIVKGSPLQLRARAYGRPEHESFEAGDEVVVVAVHDGIAEVVKPT